MAKKTVAKKTVKANVELRQLFDFTKAGYTKPNMQETKDYYTKVLRGIKFAQGRVVRMSVEDFIDSAFDYPIIENQLLIDKPELFDIKKMRFNLPYIDIIRGKTFGLDVAEFCKTNGINEIPVLLVGASKKEIDDWIKEEEIKVKLCQN